MDAYDTAPDHIVDTDKMVRNDLVDGAAVAYSRVFAVLQAKNADYASDDDPFRCFEAARIIGLHPLHGLLLRMLDKVSRASNLIDADPAVAGESLADAIDDIIGYGGIAAAWLHHSTFGGNLE